jgi:uncharacterized RDD family membrane protein YckC
MSDGSLPPPPPSDPFGSGVAVPGGHALASPWARIGARLIDGLILGIVSSVIVVGVGGTDGIDGGTNRGLSLVSLLLAVAYEVGFVGAAGATPGKMILGLRVVAQEDGTTPPGWDKAFLRYAPDLVILVPVIGGLASLAMVVLSLVWLGTDDYRRTVYDRVATTYVVKL